MARSYKEPHPFKSHPESYAAEQVQEFAGQGLQGLIPCPSEPTPRTARLGSHAFACPQLNAPSTSTLQVFLSDEQGWLATFSLAETLRDDAKQSVAELQSMGLDVRILSGDASDSVQNIAQQLGISQWQAGCSPQEKLDALHRLTAQGRHVATVGDGLNDGPVMAGAHCSLALGHALPLAQSKADFVVLSSKLSAIASSVHLSRKTCWVIKQNLIWAIAYNTACVPLAMTGYLPVWTASLGMATSSLLVIANAARLIQSE